MSDGGIRLRENDGDMELLTICKANYYITYVILLSTTDLTESISINFQTLVYVLKAACQQPVWFNAYG